MEQHHLERWHRKGRGDVPHHTLLLQNFPVELGGAGYC